MSQLYRSIVYRGKTGRLFIGEGWPVKVVITVAAAIARDVKISRYSKLLLSDSDDKEMLKALDENKLDFVAVVKADEFRVRDIVFYTVDRRV